MFANQFTQAVKALDAFHVDVTVFAGQDADTFCLEAPGRYGVVAIPTHVFYDHKVDAQGLVRWSFCKSTDPLREALQRLAGASPKG